MAPVPEHTSPVPKGSLQVSQNPQSGLDLIVKHSACFGCDSRDLGTQAQCWHVRCFVEQGWG